VVVILTTPHHYHSAITSAETIPLLSKEGRKTPVIPLEFTGEVSTPPTKEGPHKGKTKSITFAKGEVVTLSIVEGLDVTKR